MDTKKETNRRWTQIYADKDRNQNSREEAQKAQKKTTPIQQKIKKDTKVEPMIKTERASKPTANGRE